MTRTAKQIKNDDAIIQWRQWWLTNVAMSPGGGGAEYGLPVTGQTLVTREWFDSTVNSGAPGIFSGSVSGQITGGLSRGSLTAIHPTRGSGGMRKPTAAEESAGATLFDGRRLTVSGQRWLIGGWFYFYMGSSMSTKRAFMDYFLNAGFGIGFAGQWSESTPHYFTLSFGVDGDVASATIDIHKWYWIGLAVDATSNPITYKGCYQPLGGTLVAPASFSSSQALAYNAGDRIRLRQVVVANQGGLVGRVSAFSIYNIDTINTGLIYPAELGAPIVTKKAFTITSSGNDSNVEGPGLTYAWINNAIRDTVLMPIRDPWGGIPAVGAVQEKVEMAESFRDGGGVSGGDTITISSGDYFLSTAAIDVRWIDGLCIRGSSATDMPTLYGDIAITSGWSAVSGNAYSHAAIGVDNGMMWLGTTNNANGRIVRKQMTCIRTTVEATALTKMALYAPAYWTNGTTIYVDLGGTNPNTVTLYKANFSAGDNTAFIRPGNTHFEYLAFGGGQQWSTVDADPLGNTHYFIKWAASEADHYLVTLVRNCYFKEMGKHAIGCASGSGGASPNGMFIRVDNTFINGPPLTPEAGVDFGNGTWTGDVDFLDAVSQSADGTGFIGINYRMVARNLLGVRNSSAGLDSASATPYTSHVNGVQNNVFTFIGIINPDFHSSVDPSTFFTAAGPWQSAYPWWKTNAPTAGFSADDTTPTPTQEVNFTSTEDANGPAIGWYWEKKLSGGSWVPFDNDTYAENPAEIFSLGTWSVRVTQWNPLGTDVEEKTDYIVSALSGTDHDASSESHTGTTGSASEASFSWTHTPTSGNTPKGVLVYVFANSATNPVTGVTYGGTALTAVPSGEAVDAAGEPGSCKAYFLGSSVPTGAQTVLVSRTNNATVMYAVAITVTSGADSAVTGTTLIQGDGEIDEVNIDDGSPGTNSIRYAGAWSGLSSIGLLGVGANSTAIQNIDFGAAIVYVVRETTPGQGSRPVGFDSTVQSSLNDDRACVMLAVKQV